MTTALVPVGEGGDLERDPVQYMAVVLNRAKEWLSEATRIEDVRQQRAVAVGYESYIREKELAFDAQLSATEIVRRCEVRLVELIREGQAQGVIHTPATTRKRIDVTTGTSILTVAEAMGMAGGKSRDDVYAMASVSKDEFEDALAVAKSEGNLSRANVVRKVKGEAAPKSDRSEWHHKTRHLDSNRILITLAQELDALTAGLELMEPDDIDPVLIGQWVHVINSAITTIRKHVRRISS